MVLEQYFDILGIRSPLSPLSRGAQIEEQQRADVRVRKDNGLEWEQKYFHLEGENWVYNNPLDKRCAEFLATETN